MVLFERDSYVVGAIVGMAVVLVVVLTRGGNVLGRFTLPARSSGKITSTKRPNAFSSATRSGLEASLRCAAVTPALPTRRNDE